MCDHLSSRSYLLQGIGVGSAGIQLLHHILAWEQGTYRYGGSLNLTGGFFFLFCCCCCGFQLGTEMYVIMYVCMV
ncbi:hypothetical protein AQUCO_00900979v1 [Aquilegia coerulea]|uniref:Uncharacterized protein n=1 Tax=Aquilegia coerulea TaxID=218851 RepID=A0A2G5EG69_AQUCA|nr:hypothetical protein AQUCO_00900979v1 [Aquilegia coerulea]